MYDDHNCNGTNFSNDLESINVIDKFLFIIII